MTSYTITSTDSSVSLPIQAGTTNGPASGAANINTDLILYGQGSFNWGQGLEQNLLRIMESFASPAENPNDPDDQQVPDPTPVPSNPTAFGIKNPIVGQSWFNRSNGRMYACTAARSNNTEPVWSLDGEGRYLDLGGGTLSGNLDITRPTGSGPAQLRLRTNDNINDIRIELIDTISKAEFVVEQDSDNDPNTNIDLLKIIKKNGTAINNEIVLHDNFIQTHATNGRIRTPMTLDTDVDTTLTTKNYVDGRTNGGTFTEDLTIDTSRAMVRVRSADEEFPKFVLADGGGNKARIELDQTTGGLGVDHLVFSKGVFNGPNETGTTNNEIRMTDTETISSTTFKVLNIEPIISVEDTMFGSDLTISAAGDTGFIKFINNTSGQTSFITMNRGNVTINNPLANNSTVVADDDLSLTTKDFVELSANRRVHSTSDLQSRFGLVDGASVYRNVVNFQDINTAPIVPNETIMLFNDSVLSRSILLGTLSARFIITVQFNYAFEVPTPNSGPGSFSYAPVDISYRLDGVGPWTNLPRLPDFAINTFTGILTGNYMATTSLDLPSDTDFIQLRLGAAQNEFLFGPVGRTGLTWDQFSAVIIDDITYSVET